MFRWILNRVAEQRKVRLDRLTKLAREMDELLAFGRLSDDTRQRLQQSREDLQQQVRQVIFG